MQRRLRLRVLVGTFRRRGAAAARPRRPARLVFSFVSGEVPLEQRRRFSEVADRGMVRGGCQQRTRH